MRTPLLALSLPVLALAACVPPLPEAKNVAPTQPVVSIGPDGARTGDDLVVVLDMPSTDPEGGDVAYAYAWKQDGLPRTDLVTDTVPASETTKGENWEVTVTPNDGEADGAPGTAAIAIENTPPEVTVAFAPEAPSTEDDVRAVPTATDADGDDVTFTYAWTVDGSPQPDDGATIAADRTAHGQVWAVTVTPVDEDGLGDAVTAEVEIANSAPVMLSVALVPDAPYVTEDIVAVVEASDADGDALTYTYTWFVDGTEVQSGASDTLAGGGFAKHQRIGVEVVPNDGFDSGEAFLSADAVALNSLPTATGASINPASAYEASTLTCVPSGFADADGDAEGWSYAWSVNGAEVATTATLDGTSFDKDDTVACTATPWDGEESGAPVTSATLTIANTAPVLASVALSTTAPSEADTLSVTLGAATDDDGDTVSLAYSWFVNGTNVSVGSTLASSSFAKGDTLYVVVTPWDGSAWGSPVTSAVATAVNTPPTVASVTLSPRDVYTNDTLTVAVSASDLDGDGVSHTYAWYVDGALAQSGASPTLSGAAHFDRDEDVYVVVTPNDGETDGTSTTSSTVTVLNSAPTAPGVEITPEDAVEGDDLSCVVVTESTDADGDAITYMFAWDMDGVDYTGATDSATQSVVDGVDVGGGETWTCEVVAGDGALDATTRESITTAPTCNSGSVTLTASGIDFVTVCAQTFDMGCTAGMSSCSANESPVMPVTLTNNTYVSQTEITHGQYDAFMGARPSYFSGCGDDCPVEQVSWHMAAAFANAVSTAEGVETCYTCTGSGTSTSCSEAMVPYTCDGYRLLTEAEWEGAARCGADLPYAGSSSVGVVAWYVSNSGGTPHAVAGKTPNACGLYDMSGNVWEWVNDWYDASFYTAIGRTDPTGATVGTQRSLRGAAYSDAGVHLSFRTAGRPVDLGQNIGFRLARTAP